MFTFKDRYIKIFVFNNVNHHRVIILQANVIRINTKWRVIGQGMKREWRDEQFIQGFGNKQESSYGGTSGAAVLGSRFLVGRVVRPFWAAGSWWDEWCGRCGQQVPKGGKIGDKMYILNKK